MKVYVVLFAALVALCVLRPAAGRRNGCACDRRHSTDRGDLGLSPFMPSSMLWRRHFNPLLPLHPLAPMISNGFHDPWRWFEEPWMSWPGLGLEGDGCLGEEDGDDRLRMEIERLDKAEEEEQANRRAEWEARRDQLRRMREKQEEERQTKMRQESSANRKRQVSEAQSAHKDLSDRSELVSLSVGEYRPSELSLVVRGGKLIISGKHVCKCEDACSYREFSRHVKLPPNLDTSSMRARVSRRGELVVSGETRTDGGGDGGGRITGDVDTNIQVDGEEVDEREKVVDEVCAKHKQGIRLSKVDARTGSEYVQPQYIDKEVAEDEIGGDGVTIEVE